MLSPHFASRRTSCDTSGVTVATSVVQCLTMFYRSLNEILDLFGLYYMCRVA
jgi:hypothetical protein